METRLSVKVGGLTFLGNGQVGRHRKARPRNQKRLAIESNRRTRSAKIEINKDFLMAAKVFVGDMRKRRNDEQ